MKFIQRTLTLFFFLIISLSIHAEELDNTGTLIVSYHTNSSGERLNRIRFMIASKEGEESIYPKGNAFVEDTETPSRLVVIEDLPIGEYTITFLIPNQDGLFQDIPERKITIAKHNITKVDQCIYPCNKTDDATAEANKANSEIAASIITPYGTGRSGVIINQINAQLTVNTNIPGSHWTLLRYDRAVYTGVGSVVNFQVPDGDGYSVIPEKIAGYGVRISPGGRFPLYPTRTTRVDIVYQRLTGTLSLQAPFPDGETVELKLVPKDGSPATHVTLTSKGGRIFWTSQALPTGAYELFYILPEKYPPFPSERITIIPSETTKIGPHLVQGATLNIKSNASDAIFLLKTQSGSKAWKGEGREYTFQGIPAGTYILSFATNEPDFFIPPPDKRVMLSDMESKELNITFQLKGKLVVHSNISRAQITIQEIGGKKQIRQEEIQSHMRSFNLPEGKYRVTVQPLQGNTSEAIKYVVPDPVIVTIKAFKTEEIDLAFKTESISVPTLENAKTAQPEKIPQPEYVPIQQMALVQAGRAIIGDANSETDVNGQTAKIATISSFSIGINEVTNAQFASWLTEASKTGDAIYIEEADRRGQVINASGQLLFKTFEADPYSQIVAQSHSLNGKIYMPLAGKDAYPVINVSWYGATAYCKTNKCRLPTEAEWEKAAASEPEMEGEPLKKYRYGFSNNQIDKKWANYKTNDTPISRFQVLTTPVGFYNGINYLPLSIASNVQQQTQLAKSPYGAFDMSGNVWEWVSDWFDADYVKNLSANDPQGPSTGSAKVVKGGCYDSLADGVRVTERLALPPDHTDAYTGFRVAAGLH